MCRVYIDLVTTLFVRNIHVVVYILIVQLIEKNVADFI